MTPWHTPEELPDKNRRLLIQTNYGFMVGIRASNGHFTPQEPHGNNVERALRNRQNVRLIRWRYQYDRDEKLWREKNNQESITIKLKQNEDSFFN